MEPLDQNPRPTEPTKVLDEAIPEVSVAPSAPAPVSEPSWSPSTPVTPTDPVSSASSAAPVVTQEPPTTATSEPAAFGNQMPGARMADPSPAGTTPVSGPAPEPKTRRPGKGYWLWYVAAAAFAVAVASGAIISTNDDADTTPPAAAVVVAPDRIATEPAEAAPTPESTSSATTDAATNVLPDTADQGTLLDASAVGATVIPSVVTVQISGTAVNGQQGLLGSGSGVVFDDGGHIITNDHVASAGTDYEIVLADGRVYPAELVGTDPTTDLAVLSVTAEDLQPIALGNSDALTVGASAVAVGSPLGLDGGPSLTVGVISAFGRIVQTDSTTTLFGMLQTDAPITSGSSGGALVDGAGRLVGITTAVGVSEVGVEGIGFATPVEIVTRVANEIIADGVASKPYIGIIGATSFADTADGGSEPIGVIVDSVEPDTAASASGLVAGDVIAAIEGDTVNTMNELVALLRRYGAGDTIEVTLDGGATISMILGERPPGV